MENPKGKGLASFVDAGSSLMVAEGAGTGAVAGVSLGKPDTSLKASEVALETIQNTTLHR